MAATAAVEAAASPLLMTASFSGNDCDGVFGNPSGGGGKPVCDVGTALVTGDTTISPWIAKYQSTGTSASFDESNEDFGSITGGEFTFSLSGGNLTWTYDQGTNDPDVRYWVGKLGSNFNLYWMVDDVGGAAPAACTAGSQNLAVTSSASYNYECLNLALVVTSGSVPSHQLSHITFYDTSRVPPPPPPVPEPASLLLLGTGLAALASRVRRRLAQ